MKYLFKILIVCSLFQVTGCKREIVLQPRDYLFVTTGEAKVSSEGVTLSADIMNTISDEILEYGFVWSLHSDPTILDLSIITSESRGKGIYTATLTSGLVSSQSYYVRAYVKTSKYEVYGNEIMFTAL